MAAKRKEDSSRKAYEKYGLVTYSNSSANAHVRSANSIVQKALNAVAKNACKNAAAPSAELRRAYDDWQKAKAKFAKWWNPDRRLSERPPAGADEAQKAVAFSDIFLKEVGRRPPNGYGEMTLEQMLAKNATATNAAVDVPTKFVVGGVYRAPWDRDWFAKVISRTTSSIKVATKSIRDSSWGRKDEQVTLRIQPKQSLEQDEEVAKGEGWEFWASEKIR